MIKIIISLAVLCTFSAKATPTISIANEVQPAEVVADYNNTTYESDTLIYRVGTNKMNKARISFANIVGTDHKSGCVIEYQSQSGAFSFFQEIEEVNVCDHIEFSLKHTFRTEGCPVKFSINTSEKKIESVVSSCDFRASLKTNPII